MEGWHGWLCIYALLSVNPFVVLICGDGKDDYTGCVKKLNRFEIALNFAKQLLVSSFLYI
jgi:hypothetical protein